MAQEMMSININRFVNSRVSELREANQSPIYGYQHLPVLTLEKAIERIVPIVPGLEDYVAKAKENCTQMLTDLTLDESAAIYLYTMPIPFFSKLNEFLRAKNRNALKPWFAFLKLLITALEKLSSLVTTIWRGVDGNVGSTFVDNGDEIWWSINSCSKSPDVVGKYIGPTGTIFAINTLHGKDISAYSAVKDEEEVVLMPGTRLRVSYQPMNFEDRLFIVHLHEEPKYRLPSVERICEGEAPVADVKNAERRKMALVIGNNEYQTTRLLNCVNDATDLSNELKKIGFIVTTKTDVNYEAMDRGIRSFVTSIKSDDIVLFFFAGHGVQWEDQNFMIPCDEDRIEEEIDLKYRAMNAQQFLERISARNPFVIIYLLDCCREYWLPNQTRGRSLTDASKGMAHMKALAGSVIAFACAPGTVAKDKAINGRNGVFTYHLLQHISKPGENILLMMTDVTNGVANETKETQIPYVTSVLRRRDVYLVPPAWQESCSNAMMSSVAELSISSTINDLPSFKSGTKFGGSGGHVFDDSLIGDFTHSHYLRGMITGCKMMPLEWCQFLYSSSDNPENILESELQGTRPTTDIIERFFLARNERINKVQVVVNSEILYVNDIETSVPLIRGIRFFTTNGQASQSIDHLKGELYMEQFDEYTVRYVTGRAGLYVDQLQFHWYRNVMM